MLNLLSGGCRLSVLVMILKKISCQTNFISENENHQENEDEGEEILTRKLIMKLNVQN